MIHRIRQQYVYVEMNGTESEGLALQRRLPDVCHHWLTPAMERVLERCAPPTGHLYIERLEIDIGTVTLGHVEHDLPELVAVALEKAIREQMPAEGTPSVALGDNSVQYKTTQQTRDEAFLYFLATGTLPWSFRLPVDYHLEHALLNAWRDGAASGFSSPTVNASVLRVLASATARQRLIRQFSPVFLETLLSLLSPAAKSVVDGIVPVLRRATAPLADLTAFVHQLWEIVFADVAAGQVPLTRHLVGDAWHALPMTAVASSALASVLEHHWPGATRMTGIEIKPIERTTQTPPRHPGGLILPPSPVSEKAPSDIGESSEAGVQQAYLEAREARASREHPEARDGIFIENAGLVVLHPFLPQFFAALNIATAGKLVQPERALCLLHFLTTGQFMVPEYALILPKILCNIPLLTPVETNLELTHAETEEAIALLNAVIGHWDVLRNTSPDGLRGTFLLRPGKVSWRDDGDWVLQVEPRSVDILLEQLPWGISMITLPWMDTMLWVEWG